MIKDQNLADSIVSNICRAATGTTNMIAEDKAMFFMNNFESISQASLEAAVKNTPTENQKLSEQVYELKSDLRALEDEYDELEEELDGKMDVSDVEQVFKEENGISASLFDEQKFDLIMKNYHKVSLEDLEQFFQSKGLEIV